MLETFSRAIKNIKQLKGIYYKMGKNHKSPLLLPSLCARILIRLPWECEDWICNFSLICRKVFFFLLINKRRGSRRSRRSRRRKRRMEKEEGRRRKEYLN